jgi:hypothetical protein
MSEGDMWATFGNVLLIALIPHCITVSTVIEDHCDSSVSEAGEDQRDRCTLFLGDLSLFCTEKDVENAFTQFGQIVEVRIQRSKETARALSYGFIEFSEPTVAQAALNSMNNYVLKGRPLRYVKPSTYVVSFVNSMILNFASKWNWCDHRRVGWAADRNNPVKSTIAPHDPAASVYVRFLTMKTTAVVSEEILRDMFSYYGPVFDCAIKKLRMDPVSAVHGVHLLRAVAISPIAVEQKTNRSKGYAFISYHPTGLARHGRSVTGVEATYSASLHLGNCVVNDVRYRCEVGHRLYRRGTTLAHQAVVLHTLPRVNSLPASSSEYDAAYSAGYVQYGNGSEYYPSYYTQDPAQRNQPQAPGQPHAQVQALSAPPSTPMRTCYAYTSPPRQMVSPSAGHYLPCTAYVPVPVSPQVIYGNRSFATTYEPQMLTAHPPQFHVFAPRKVYASAYPPANALSPSTGALSSGTLGDTPTAAAHIYQPQQQGQYAAQTQYAYPYLVQSPSTTPPRDYSEMGLRAHSFSSDSATAGYSVSSPTSPQQMPVSTPQTSYANVYMALQAPQQSAGYASCMPHVVQAQPSMYYLPQQQISTAAQYCYPYVVVPSAPANTGDGRHEMSPSLAAHTESVLGAEVLPQAVGDEEDTEYSVIGEAVPPTPRGASWLPGPCLAPPPPSPATGSQRVLRFPQIGAAAPPMPLSVPSITSASCAQNVLQHVQAHGYRNQKVGFNRDDVSVPAKDN